ncbi:uncharacterized protein J3D65DRAFT_611682 [Phyllosticta citribraziliensis]|uniref:Uncharacterized protein n=1 Tax=Phyllosticta citribraziliensis TaxID=989973 RepID=A0ABR1MCY6_9PEZI
MSTTISAATKQVLSELCEEGPPVVIQYREAGAANSSWSYFGHESPLDMRFLCYQFPLRHQQMFLLRLKVPVSIDDSFDKSSDIPVDVDIWDRCIETFDISLYLYESRKWGPLVDVVDAGDRMMQEEGICETFTASGTTYSVKIRPRTFAEIPKPVYEAFYFDGRQYEGDIVQMDLRLHQPPAIALHHTDSIVPCGPNDRVVLENLFSLSKSLTVRIFLRRSNVRMLRVLWEMSLKVQWRSEFATLSFQAPFDAERLWTVKTRKRGYEWYKFHHAKGKKYEIRTRVDKPGYPGTEEENEGDEAKDVRGQDSRGCEKEQSGNPPQSPETKKSNSTFTVDTESGVLSLMFGTEDSRTTVEVCP